MSSAGRIWVVGMAVVVNMTCSWRDSRTLATREEQIFSCEFWMSSEVHVEVECVNYIQLRRLKDLSHPYLGERTILVFYHNPIFLWAYDELKYLEIVCLRICNESACTCRQWNFIFTMYEIFASSWLFRPALCARDSDNCWR